MRRSDRFEELCRDHYARIARLAFLMTGDRQEALDLAQEGFARAFEHWRRVSRLDLPERWVQRVVINLAISWRRRRRRVMLQRELPDSPTAPLDPHEPALKGALGSLTPAQRVVIVLRYYQDWSVADVADALGKRPGTVRALTAQGMERLRRILGPREVHDEARG